MIAYQPAGLTVLHFNLITQWAIGDFLKTDLSCQGQNIKNQAVKNYIRDVKLFLSIYPDISRSQRSWTRQRWLIAGSLHTTHCITCNRPSPATLLKQGDGESHRGDYSQPSSNSAVMKRNTFTWITVSEWKSTYLGVTQRCLFCEAERWVAHEHRKTRCCIMRANVSLAIITTSLAADILYSVHRFA